tara:strand:+ start:453 stop:953 length:501 start_codon:yes stop_codon:yes gene_type:complete
MKVVDNFLPIEQFNKIQSTLLSNFFPWYWYDDSTYEGDGDDQLVHNFITEGKIHSDFFHLFNDSDCFKLLNVDMLYKHKANLNYKRKKHHIGFYHTDFSDSNENILTTSIMYINTNNGYTMFQDGTKVKSIANRMVIFDCSTRHAAVTCTDEMRRVVVNFNFTTRT